MSNRDRGSIIAIPFILLFAAFIAWAGSQGGYNVSGIPVFALCIALAFILMWIAFIPAFIKQTEKFYDLAGSFTYLALTWLAFILVPMLDIRSWLLAVIVSIWAIRLGVFLTQRVRAAGEDRRFREIKTSFTPFLLAWTLQGLWVSLTLAAALAAITTQTALNLDVYTYIGFAVWLLGFGIEVVADRQKTAFRSNPNNADKFINEGFWSWSRHPNYFGEIVLWFGIAIIAFPVLSGWQYLTLISPLFVILLLTRVSGIPMLEANADHKWGGQEDYEEYKASTSILILRPPSKQD